MKVLYDMPYFKEIIAFFAVPLLVILVGFLIGLDLYSIKTKNKDEHYNYVMNFYSLLLAVIVCAFLTALTTGFSISFIKSMLTNHIANDHKILFYSGFVFPILPFGCLIVFMIKFYENYKEKKHRYKIDNVEILDDVGEVKKEKIEVL